MSTASKAKAARLLTSLQHGRVYRSTRVHDLFYRIEQVQAGNGIVIVSSFNPDPKAQRRRVRGRAMQAASLAAYDLKLLAPEDEPKELLSKEGEAHLERKQKEAAKDPQTVRVDVRALAEDAAIKVLELADGNGQMSVHAAAKALVSVLALAAQLSAALEAQA